jgi:hypothetical protein
MTTRAEYGNQKLPVPKCQIRQGHADHRCHDDTGVAPVPGAGGIGFGSAREWECRRCYRFLA